MSGTIPPLLCWCLSVLIPINFIPYCKAVSSALTLHEGQQSPATGVIRKVLNKYGRCCVANIVDVANILHEARTGTSLSIPVIIFRWHIQTDNFADSWGDHNEEQNLLCLMNQRYRFKQVSALRLRVSKCLTTLLLGRRLHQFSY